MRFGALHRALAAGDLGIAHLPRGREPRKGLLTDGVPVDEIHSGDVHRGVDAREPRD
jgi:hypothetical protein